MVTDTIDQAFHGYDQGHRLLAASTTLHPSESTLLDRLSDLSGFLPNGTEIPEYLTMFPCGRFYVFARTWPDHLGTRGGTVLTHSLLVPLERAVTQESVDGIGSLFRQPASVADREAYRDPLPWPETPAPPWAPLAEDDDLRSIAAMLLGRVERPVARVDAIPRDDLVLRFWRLIWPAARRDFAACTFALGVRRLATRPFDLLIVPPGARSAFAEPSRPVVWWDPLRKPRVEVAGVDGAPWFDDLCGMGPLWRDRLVQWTSARGLSMPALGATARLERLRAMEQGSAERLSAARARVDLTTTLWPSLPSDHPWLVEGVRRLVMLQSSASDAPSPLRELQDMVHREELARVVEQDAMLCEDLLRVLRTELARRMDRSLLTSPEELAALLGSALPTTWTRALTAGVVDAIVQHPEPESRRVAARRLITTLPTAAKMRVLGAMLVALHEEERVPMMDALASAVSAEERLIVWGAGLQYAVRERDARLYLSIHERVGNKARAARQVIVWALQADEDEARARILEKVPLDARVEWCFGELDEAWRPLAVRLGPSWLNAVGMSGEEIARRCGRVRHGVALLARWLDTQRYERVVELLGRVRPWPRIVVMAALSGDASVSPDGDTVRAAIAAGTLEDWTAPEVRASLVRDELPSLADQVAARVTPALIGNVLRGVDPEHTARWLDVPAVMRWFGREGVDGTRRVAEWSLWRAGLPYVLAAWIASGGERTAVRPQSWEVLLTLAIREASRDALDRAAREELRTWLGRPGHALALHVAAEMLIVIRREKPRSGALWVAQCFPLVYPLLLRDGEDPFARTLWRSSYGWDRARDWREWVADVWLKEAWPPALFLHALGGSRELLDGALGSLRYHWGAHDFVRGLRREALRDRALALWAPALEQWDERFGSMLKRFS